MRYWLAWQTSYERKLQWNLDHDTRSVASLLLDRSPPAERGGTLGALDESEQIESWREVEVEELPRVANALANLTAAGSRDIGGSWTAWGKFRSVVHGVVYEALMSPGGRT